MRSKADRHRALALGRAAEELAREFLVGQGYRIIAANQLTEGGELDLIVWDGPVLVFVEVRARGDDWHGRPEETVDRRKQERLAAAAGAYLTELSGPPPVCRFDVVAVSFQGGRPSLKHFRDAFRVGE